MTDTTKDPLEGIDINELIDPARYKTTLNQSRATWQDRLSGLKVDLDILEDSFEMVPPESEEDKAHAEEALKSLKGQVRTVALRIVAIDRRLEQSKENDEKLMRGPKEKPEAEE